MDKAAPPSDPPRGSRLASRLLVGAALLLLIAFSASVRVRTAFADPNFDAQHAEGLLKSDPALLYYFTERILDAGGRVPGDFRADPRVQHPALTDVPAEFTVGQEFLVAWAYRLFGGGRPLHAFCVQLMAWTASLAALGVFLLARAFTGRSSWGLFAAALFVLAPANYRTIGFVLVREDLALPLYALHLGLLGEAARRRRPALYLLAGFAAAGALATWHASGFLFAVQLACLAAWFLRRGEDPFGARGSWSVLLGPVLAATFVPALRAQAALLSLPFQLALALLAVRAVRVARAARALRKGEPVQGPGRGAALVLGVGVAAALALARVAVHAPSGYAHVWDVFLAKLVHAGRFPADPQAISFDARLLWQGPFDTLNLGWAFEQHVWLLPLALPLVLVAAAVWIRSPRMNRASDVAEAWLGAFVVASAVLAWLFTRMLVLPGLLLPVAAAVVVGRYGGRRLVAPIACVALVLQGLILLDFARDHVNRWYLPPNRQAEIAGLVEWVDEHLPDDEPVVADFMNSTAILASAGNPIVLQPKYETEASRRRAQAFLQTFFHGPPEAMRALVRERFGSRYVLFDTFTLGRLSRATAGLAPDEPLPPGSCAALFLASDEAVLRAVPGFELVYRSPPAIRAPDGSPSDFFRLYRVD